MKKLFICFTASLALLSSLAMAKTEGPSVQLNLIQSTLDVVVNQSESGDDKFGAGIGVKYAIPLGNKIYVAPSGFYDHNGVDVSALDLSGGVAVNTNSKLSYSYGAGIDLGYDINSQYSVFINASWIEARVSQDESIKFSEEDISYGFGLKYNISKELAAELSYNKVELLQQGGVDLETLKLGVAYSF